MLARGRTVAGRQTLSQFTQLHTGRASEADKRKILNNLSGKWVTKPTGLGAYYISSKKKKCLFL